MGITLNNLLSESPANLGSITLQYTNINRFTFSRYTHFLSRAMVAFEYTKINQDSMKLISGRIHGKVDYAREKMAEIIHNCLLDPSTRSRAVAFLAAVVNANIKKSQLRANEAIVSQNGFILNVLTVLQKLSSKVKIEKVSLDYLLQPNSLLKNFDETRIKMTSEELKALCAK